MSHTYELRIDSRNVNFIGTKLGKHTGYELITYDENHNVVNIQTVALFNEGGKIVFKDGNYNVDIPLGADVIPPLMYQDGEWVETSPQWAQDNAYRSVTIPLSSDDAFDIFNQIKTQTDLINKLGEMGLSLDYNPVNQNCNSWAGFINSNLFPDQNIFELLNSGLVSPDEYQGAYCAFPYEKYSANENLFQLVLDILSYLKENNLILEDINLQIEQTPSDYTIIINDQIIIQKFVINILPVIDYVKSAFATAEVQTSPLILDLDGDGVETIGTNSGVYFDHANDGFKENTGWVGKDDGLLVRDINGNGQIDNGTELFGNNSVLSNGKKAKNGFEALKDLDSNQDYVFDQNDAAWNEVKVWKDSNSNGIVDEGELLTMEQVGITGFDLNYQSQSRDDANGNAHLQTSTITKADGTTADITDVWFKTDTANSVDTTHITIPDNIKALPDVAGFGNVHSLHIAMALDESGALKALIEQYAATTDKAEREKILDNIIYHWAGVQDEDPRGRDPAHTYGKVIDDCRKLEALEEFMGRDYAGTWCWGERDPNPHGRAAPFILQAYDILKEYVNNSLLAQTHYKSMLESIPLTYNSETGKWEADTTALTAAWETAYAADQEGTQAMMKEFARVLNCFGTNGQLVAETIRNSAGSSGSSFENALLMFGVWENSGTENNDALYGTDSNDLLEGKAGNDNLFGNGGDDLLIGGAGNDYLIGGNGDDIYHFDPGFGDDALDNLQDESVPNSDIIRFGEGILPDKVSLGRQGFDLIITVSYAPDEDGSTRPNDSLRVYSYFDKQGTTSATVSTITFADGTSWDYDYVSTHWNSVPDINGGVTREGNNEDNSLSGTQANDILIGNGGNDTINGYGGNDRLFGGAGNDNLSGGDGDDTYLYNLGDGLDTIMDSGNRDKISFGEGISFEDLSFSLVKHNYLKITVKGDENQGIIIQNFNGGLNYKIEDLYFYDGSVVHLSEIPLTYRQNDEDEVLQLSDNGDTIYAEGGKDQIIGGMGNDTIAGGKGWDVINGGRGQNTYVWNLGDGFDTITCDYDSDDSIKFGAGIKFEDLTFRYDYPHLVILVNGDETQGMTISRPQYLHYLKFANGRTVDLTKTGLTYHQTDDVEASINGSDNNDVIYGFGGDDTISAAGGNDMLIGGKGCDTLNGGDGDDTYVWNLGDGLDTVSDSSGTTTLQFGEGITLDNLTFEKSSNQWRVYVNGDRTQGFYCSQGMPDIIKLADGSVLKMNETGWNIYNSDNNDNIQGSVYDDVINGGGGDDSITSEDGNDTLIGGKGDDSLVGGDGDDTYVWNLGDGFDTISDNSGTDRIKFGAGITFDDLSFAKNPNGGLDIYVKGDRSQGLCVLSQYVSGSNKKIEMLEFVDGSTFDLINNEINLSEYLHVVLDNKRQEMTEMNGSDGADQMTNRYDYSVTFNGGKGNDHYNGGGGADTYIYNLGDGMDSINDTSGDDRIKFGPGISYEDLSFRTNYAGSLTIFVDPEMTQGLKLSSRSSIKYLEFADGSVVDFSTQNFVVRQDNKDESLEINDNRITHLYMGDGDSTVYNRVGHDITIIGGKGNDTIRGGSGVDTYVWNLGDGMDNLRDTEAKDKIVFGAGITAADLTFRKERNGLRIIVKNDENQGMLIANYQLYNQNELKKIYFADGSSLDISQSIVLHQTNADDEFCVGYGDNTVYCGAGNDKIESYGGDNIYVGGTGNDSFSDWDGDDTYIYNLGDGFDSISDGGGDDKIVFGEGINPGDLSFKRNENNLSISINGNEEQGIEISNHFGSDSNKIETIEFHDGSTLDISNADQLIQAMNSFSISNSASTDTPSNPTQDVTDMYSLAANSDLTRKAA